jgi:putative oxidoreductase
MTVIGKINVALQYPDLGLLILRLWLGTLGVFHGAQKLFGAFGGHGMAGFTEFLRSLGVPAPSVSAYCAAGAEFFGGILIAMGLFTRLASMPFAINMVVAIAMVHNKGFALPDGFEFAATVLAGLLALILAGPGRFSADMAIGKFLANLRIKP